jgi:hypothetical protein
LLTPEQCDTLFSRVRTQLLEVRTSSPPIHSLHILTRPSRCTSICLRQSSPRIVHHSPMACS